MDRRRGLKVNLGKVIGGDDLMKFYLDNRDLSWADMSRKLGLCEPERDYVECDKQGKRLATHVGMLLMKECREIPSCPMKALLPETRIKKGPKIRKRDTYSRIRPR